MAESKCNRRRYFSCRRSDCHEQTVYFVGFLNGVDPPHYPLSPTTPLKTSPYYRFHRLSSRTSRVGLSTVCASRPTCVAREKTPRTKDDNNNNVITRHDPLNCRCY